MLSFFFPSKVEEKSTPILNEILIHEPSIKETNNERIKKKDTYYYEYYENGKVKLEREQKTGFEKIYDEDGILLSEYYLKNGYINGKCYSYYKTGKLESIEDWFNGKLNGLSTYFYSNGNIKTEIYYKNNIKHGIEREYSKIGLLLKKNSYCNGFLDGHFSTYYINGKKYQEGTYKNGNLHGILFIYSEYGKVEIIKEYKNGIHNKFST